MKDPGRSPYNTQVSLSDLPCHNSLWDRGHRGGSGEKGKVSNVIWPLESTSSLGSWIHAQQGRTGGRRQF